MNYQTNEQLSELRLNAMKLEYQRQSELPAISELSFDERFSMIVTAQLNARYEATSNYQFQLINIHFKESRRVYIPYIQRIPLCMPFPLPYLR